MFSSEGGTSSTPFNPMRRAAAINMQADAAGQPQPVADATPPHHAYISWAPQGQGPITTGGGAGHTMLAQGPITTGGGAGHTMLSSPTMWHISSAERSPALSNMGALKSYLEYCGDSARRDNAVQVLAQQSEEVLEAFASRIHERVAELAASEAVEYQRARVLCVMDFGPASPSRGDIRPGSREVAVQLPANIASAEAALSSVPMIDTHALAEGFSWQCEPQKKRLRFSTCMAGQDMVAGMRSGSARLGEIEQQQQLSGFALRNASQDRLRVVAPA